MLYLSKLRRKRASSSVNVSGIAIMNRPQTDAARTKPGFRRAISPPATPVRKRQASFAKPRTDHLSTNDPSTPYLVSAPDTAARPSHAPLPAPVARQEFGGFVWACSLTPPFPSRGLSSSQPHAGHHGGPAEPF